MGIGTCCLSSGHPVITVVFMVIRTGSWAVHVDWANGSGDSLIASKGSKLTLLCINEIHLLFSASFS